METENQFLFPLSFPMHSSVKSPSVAGESPVCWAKEQTPVDLSEGDQGITAGRAAQGPVTADANWVGGQMGSSLVKMGIWTVKIGSTGVKLDQHQ